MTDLADFNPQHLDEKLVLDFCSLARSGRIQFTRRDHEFVWCNFLPFHDVTIVIRDNRYCCDGCPHLVPGQTCSEHVICLGPIHFGLYYANTDGDARYGIVPNSPVVRNALCDLAEFLRINAQDDPPRRTGFGSADEVLGALVEFASPLPAHEVPHVDVFPEMTMDVYQEIDQAGYEVYAHARVCPSGNPSHLMLNKINAWFKGQWAR